MPQTPQGGGTGGAGSGGGGGGGANDQETFQRYADCLDKADPQDTAALQRCSELLR